MFTGSHQVWRRFIFFCEADIKSRWIIQFPLFLMKAVIMSDFTFKEKKKCLSIFAGISAAEKNFKSSFQNKLRHDSSSVKKANSAQIMLFHNHFATFHLSCEKWPEGYFNTPIQLFFIKKNVKTLLILIYNSFQANFSIG